VNVARVVALGIHWALFVLIPVGLLNPFAEMDGVFGHPPIPIWAIFAMVWGIGALNCCAIIALSKFKDQFGPRNYAT
jgi:hypothetical protein